MDKLILVGGGGHCKSCIDTIEQENKYQINGILDIKDKVGQEIFGYKIIGTNDDIEFYVKQGNLFLITIGQIEDASVRIRLFEKIKSYNGKLATIISPRAYISKHSSIEEGTIVLNDVLINSNAKIGKNCIINSKALIEHDTIVESNCHISTGAIINGGCIIKENTFIGSNATIVQGSVVPPNSFVKASSIFKEYNALKNQKEVKLNIDNNKSNDNSLNPRWGGVIHTERIKSFNLQLHLIKMGAA